MKEVIIGMTLEEYFSRFKGQLGFESVKEYYVITYFPAQKMIKLYRRKEAKYDK